MRVRVCYFSINAFQLIFWAFVFFSEGKREETKKEIKLKEKEMYIHQRVNENEKMVDFFLSSQFVFDDFRDKSIE